ncbi:hypothetical protein FOL47_002653 [Perkinsus chesapeaki]|uniref:F-box domain-containing protein n=1 Tax=Perkinsus chesapeaki TaxID=330153 RepID=A0A7J6MC53_PERCH|nr:hypothetical protein FOL47_002653 [Perkinsus chesapeaki]
MALSPSSIALRRSLRRKSTATTSLVIEPSHTTPGVPVLPLLDLPDGVLLCILKGLGPRDLIAFETSCIDARRKCRCLRVWCELGCNVFHGQLHSDESFLDAGSSPTSNKRVSIDWKLRYRIFATFSTTFRDTDRSTMTFIDERDYVAYLSARIDVESLKTSGGVYVEVLVQKNADNLSLACVDFDSGGKSSVTFSPDTGAVIKESKIQENPRKVSGSYRQPLAQIQQLKPFTGSLVLSRFEGLMGMLLTKEGIAFYRRLPGLAWECTGIITDLAWIHGNYVTPCIAFRDNGIYHVIIRKLGVYPPPTTLERRSLEPPVLSEDEASSSDDDD